MVGLYRNKRSSPVSSRLRNLRLNFILSYTLSQDLRAVHPWATMEMSWHLDNLDPWLKDKKKERSLRKSDLGSQYSDCAASENKTSSLCPCLSTSMSMHLDALCNPSLGLNSLSGKMGRVGGGTCSQVELLWRLNDLIYVKHHIIM